MLDIQQLRELIVRPTLQKMQMWSDSAEDLMIGTAILESRLIYLRQKPDGPAVSIYQIEPITYKDLRIRLMLDYKNIKDKVLSILCMEMLPINADFLIGNLTAATIFARLKYYFDPQPLPASNDFNGLANYYKRVYNTQCGDTKIEKAISVFKATVLNYSPH